MTTRDPVAVLTRFLDAVVEGDLDTVRGIYHPDAVVWHNDDEKEQSVDENLAVMGWMVRKFPGFHYTDVRRQATEAGAVEQHVTVIPVPGREPVRMPACLVVDIDDDGRITRLDEYLDSAAVAELQAAIG